MDKNNKKTSSQKRKVKEKDKIIIKVDSKNKEVQTRDNISQQRIILGNAEVSVEQNSSDQTNKRQILPLEGESSDCQIQPQQIIYQQPIVVNMKGAIPQTNNMNNKLNELSNLKIKVGQNPKKMECPFCHQLILSITEDQFNCFSFFVFMLMIIIFPIFFIYNICIDINDCYCSFGCDSNSNGCCYLYCCRCERRGTINCLCCCDVFHFCPNCRKLIGFHNSRS